MFVSWLCLLFVVAAAAGMVLIPVEMLPEKSSMMFHWIIAGLALGWLSEIWSNREKIKRKMALLIFLGYAVWVAITENNFKFSDAFCRWESIIMAGAILFAVLFVGGCNESDA